MVRWLIRRDMPSVLSINADTGINVTSEEDFIKMLRDRKTIGSVAEDADGQIIAYVIYQLAKRQLTVLMMEGSQEGKLMLLNRLDEKLSVQRRDTLDIEVHECDMSTLFLLRDLGFRSVTTLRNYFGNRDGIILRRKVSDLQTSVGEYA